MKNISDEIDEASSSGLNAGIFMTDSHVWGKPCRLVWNVVARRTEPTWRSVESYMWDREDA